MTGGRRDRIESVTARPLTVGTAGHIDHGKTWLVRALTGKDTDRLPEERRRGISIDLGYAPLELPGGRRLSLVDVPGHERFVRNMVAGATGIDLFLLVIDAAEGARPQTHEHLAILRLLGIERGVVAVTKADAVDEETLELALAEGARARPGRRGRRGQREDRPGLDELRAALAAAAEATERVHPDGPARLYVDRVFTLRGIGTVVTGHALVGNDRRRRRAPRRAGGTRRARPERPGARPARRARGGRAAGRGRPARASSERGSPAATPSSSRAPTRSPTGWTCALDELEDVPAAVTVHLGTADVAARVAAARPLRPAPARAPVVAARGDRVVLRAKTTVGGGVVLDPLPPRRARPRAARAARARRCRRDRPRAGARGLAATIWDALHGVERAGEWVFSREWLDELRDGRARTARSRRPARSGDRPPGRPVGRRDRAAARRRAPGLAPVPARGEGRRPSGARSCSPRSRPPG